MWSALLSGATRAKMLRLVWKQRFHRTPATEPCDQGLIGFGHLLRLDTSSRYSLLVVAASACYGTAVNIIKSYLHDVSSSRITSLSFLLTAPFLLIYLIGFTDFMSQLRTEPASWWGVLYISLLGILSTALAVILFNRLIKYTTAIFASSVTYLIPVVAVGWGVLDGETVATTQLGYLALILGGIFLINLPRGLFRTTRSRDAVS